MAPVCGKFPVGRWIPIVRAAHPVRQGVFRGTAVAGRRRQEAATERATRLEQRHRRAAPNGVVNCPELRKLPIGPRWMVLPE
jgi:hypothetical protein